MARVAVDAIAKRIVPNVSHLTCVAYGNWSRRCDHVGCTARCWNRDVNATINVLELQRILE
ncbi:hypothetical protein JG688_00010125 [Phytophthora aleatoria]|uniref:Uncharacterized protein n=1 Tax=Phytophthora aleatoria TaxID=2496075 RepID=A0A8J5M660_9STRA|nr:hypothetical protein JG688_00010125 [Phytophthora aleatoria]